MVQSNEGLSKPRIVVSDTDFKRLTDLALGAIDRFPEVAQELEIEMGRAEVVQAESVPSNVVRMDSIVEFRTDSAQQRRVQLVFPGDADISQDRISVLTPIGVALIGLSAGQSIAWTARDGKQHKLTVITVEQPGETPTVVAFAARKKSASKMSAPGDDDPGPPRAA
jgi:regulator of nucleoside diphosphate kinase